MKYSPGAPVYGDTIIFTGNARITAVSAADFSVLPGNADRSALRGVLGADMKISGTKVPADLKLSFRKMFAGQFANVYKLSGKSLEFMGCVKLDEDGAAVISGVDSAGEYVVMVCGFSDLPGDITNDGVLNAINAAADKSFHFSVPLRNLSGRIFSEFSAPDAIQAPIAELVIDRQ